MGFYWSRRRKKRLQRIAAYSTPAAAVNDTAPSIDTAPIVDAVMDYAAGTWTNADSVSAQAIRATTADGTYSAVGDAWDSVSGTPYTYQASDFGYFFKVRETAEPGGVTAESAATAAVAEVPVQSLGAELLANPSFTAWTTDNPNGWTIGGEVASDPMVTQVDAGGGAGTGAARFYSSATNNSPNAAQTGIAVTGDLHLADITVSAYVGGHLNFFETGFAEVVTVNAAGRAIGILRAGNTGVRIQGGNSGLPTDLTLSEVSYKKITPNAQLTAPAANKSLALRYTLPASPVKGSQVRLLGRISSFSSGNYWRLKLEYTGSQWDLVLQSLASHTPTARITSANVGSTNGLRVNFSGDSISIYTTNDDFGTETQRGSTITNSLYNTATGVNVIYTPDFTIGTLEYAAPF